MQPGENRWVAIRRQIDRGTPVPISIFDLDRGKPVNGFTLIAQAVPLGKAVQENLRNHVPVRTVWLRRSMSRPDCARHVRPEG